MQFPFINSNLLLLPLSMRAYRRVHDGSTGVDWPPPPTLPTLPLLKLTPAPRRRIRLKGQPPDLNSQSTGTNPCPSFQVFDLLMSNSSATDLCSKVRENTTKFRNGMTSAGFTILGENHPICPVFLGDAKLASNFANLMMGEEIEEQFFSFSFTESLIMIENYQIK